jgi:hypothetical protein
MGIPERIVTPIEYGFIFMGITGSLFASYMMKFIKMNWIIFIMALGGFALWVMSLPMEMRGTAVGIN